MFLDRTGDQQALAEACRQLLVKEWPIEKTAGALAVAPRPAGPWDAAVEMGWLHVMSPEASGGLGLSAVEAGAVSEEAGRALFPGPLVEAIAVGASGVADPAATTLAPFATTELVQSAGLVTGSASDVPYADMTDHALVRIGDELWTVATHGRGVTVQVQPSVDPVARPCLLAFDAAPASRVGGPDLALSTEILVHCLLAARLLGIIDAALERTAIYAQQREQFGRPIGSFQAVQQLLADLKKRAVATRSVCYVSQAAIAAGRPDAARWANAAKAYASRSARAVAEGCIQAHGGIGFTTEVPLHLYLKHVLSLQWAWGTAGDHERALARAALAGVSPS